MLNKCHVYSRCSNTLMLNLFSCLNFNQCIKDKLLQIKKNRYGDETLRLFTRRKIKKNALNRNIFSLIIISWTGEEMLLLKNSAQYTGGL